MAKSEVEAKVLPVGVTVGYDAVKGEDYVSCEKVSTVYAAMAPATRKAIALSAVETLDSVALGIQTAQDIDGSTFAYGNIWVRRNPSTNEFELFGDLFTVGDSEIRLKSDEKTPFQPQTQSHNLSIQAVREPWRIKKEGKEGKEGKVEYEKDYLFHGAAGWRHRAVAMGRSIGDPFSKEDPKFTAEPSFVQKVIPLGTSDALAPSPVRMRFNSDGIYYGMEGGSTIADCGANYLPPGAVITQARVNGSTDDIVIIDIDPNQLPKEGVFGFGVFDGHGGKRIARLCAELYPFIQGCWISFYEKHHDPTPEEVKAFKQKLIKAFSDYRKTPLQTQNSTALKNWLREKLGGNSLEKQHGQALNLAWMDGISAEVDVDAWKKAAAVSAASYSSSSVSLPAMPASSTPAPSLPTLQQSAASQPQPSAEAKTKAPPPKGDTQKSGVSAARYFKKDQYIPYDYLHLGFIAFLSEKTSFIRAGSKKKSAPATTSEEQKQPDNGSSPKKLLSDYWKELSPQQQWSYIDDFEGSVSFDGSKQMGACKDSLSMDPLAFGESTSSSAPPVSVASVPENKSGFTITLPNHPMFEGDVSYYVEATMLPLDPTVQDLANVFHDHLLYKKKVDEDKFETVLAIGREGLRFFGTKGESQLPELLGPNTKLSELSSTQLTCQLPRVNRHDITFEGWEEPQIKWEPDPPKTSSSRMVVNVLYGASKQLGIKPQDYVLAYGPEDTALDVMCSPKLAIEGLPAHQKTEFTILPTEGGEVCVVPLRLRLEKKPKATPTPQKPAKPSVLGRLVKALGMGGAKPSAEEAKKTSRVATSPTSPAPKTPPQGLPLAPGRRAHFFPAPEGKREVKNNQVALRDKNGREYLYCYDPKDTISSLKTLLFEETGTSFEAIRIMRGVEPLADNRTIASFPPGQVWNVPDIVFPSSGPRPSVGLGATVQQG